MLGDLGKLIVAKGFKKLPKVQKIARSGHTDWQPPRPSFSTWTVEVADRNRARIYRIRPDFLWDFFPPVPANDVSLAVAVVGDCVLRRKRELRLAGHLVLLDDEAIFITSGFIAPAFVAFFLGGGVTNANRPLPQATATHSLMTRIGCHQAGVLHVPTYIVSRFLMVIKSSYYYL